MFVPAVPCRAVTPFALAAAILFSLLPSRVSAAERLWRKHVIHHGAQSLTAVAGDFTKDGQPDIIANSSDKTRLFVGPDWKEIVLDATAGHDFIHSETFDVDGDGDLDGDLDAATCAYGDKEAWWFENDGKGNFTLHLVARDQEAYDIRAFDIDQDSDLDLLIAGRASNNVAWYENPGN
jgi:FG-GAP-like repeat